MSNVVPDLLPDRLQLRAGIMLPGVLITELVENIAFSRDPERTWKLVETEDAMRYTLFDQYTLLGRFGEDRLDSLTLEFKSHWTPQRLQNRYGFIDKLKAFSSSCRVAYDYLSVVTVFLEGPVERPTLRFPEYVRPFSGGLYRMRLTLAELQQAWALTTYLSRWKLP